MKTDKEYRVLAEESLDKVIEEISTGELFFQFSIGYSWDDPPKDHDHLTHRQGALQAVTSLLNANMDAIMSAARDEAQRYIEEWVESDKEEALATSTKMLEELDKTIHKAQEAGNVPRTH